MTAPLTTRDLGDLSPSTAKRVALAGITPISPAIAQIINAINTNPGAVPGFARMVAHSGLGKGAFQSAFLAATGAWAQQYVIEARMRMARELLATTDLEIRVIAGRVGYSTRERFSAAFVAEHGVYPTQYREQVRP